MLCAVVCGALWTNIAPVNAQRNPNILSSVFNTTTAWGAFFDAYPKLWKQITTALIQVRVPGRRLIDLFDRHVDWLSDRLFDWLIVQLIDWLNVRLIDRLIDWTVCSYSAFSLGTFDFTFCRVQRQISTCIPIKFRRFFRRKASPIPTSRSTTQPLACASISLKCDALCWTLVCRVQRGWPVRVASTQRPLAMLFSRRSPFLSTRPEVSWVRQMAIRRGFSGAHKRFLFFNHKFIVWLCQKRFQCLNRPRWILNKIHLTARAHCNSVLRRNFICLYHTKDVA